MRNGENGFVSKYADGKIKDSNESAFYNGEAFLALALYYNFENDEVILSEIQSLWPYYRDSYIANYDGNFYLWGMLALKELYYVIPMEEVSDFVSLYTKARIKKFRRNKNSDELNCPYMEGISAANFILKDETSDDSVDFRDELYFWFKKNSDFQINSEEYFDLKIKNLRTSKGGFAMSSIDPTLRIDNTQHCLNAYLIEYVDIAENSLP
jgi:hypothetical protein